MRPTAQKWAACALIDMPRNENQGEPAGPSRHVMLAQAPRLTRPAGYADRFTRRLRGDLLERNPRGVHIPVAKSPQHQQT